jgi:hypothetical protein
MFPMRMSSVFKSRWMAMLWAAGIIWFAYDFAGSQPQAASNDANAEQTTDVTGTPVTPEDQKRVTDALRSF